MASDSDDAVALRLRLIGPMQAWAPPRRNVLPNGKKAQAVLACLALTPGHRMSRARLAELLTGGRTDDQARIALRHDVHALAEALRPAGPDILRVARDHVALRPDQVWIDVRQIEQAGAAALPLFDAELLEDMDGLGATFDSWLMTERQRLRDRVRGAAEALLAGQSEPDGILLAARRVLLLDPTQEGAWRALIRAWLRLGDLVMASQAYERCRETLSRRLDVAPSAETRALLAEMDAAVRQPAPVIQPGARAATRIAIAPPPRAAAGPGDGAAPTPDIAQGIAEGLDRFGWLTVIPPAAFAGWGGRELDETRVRHEVQADLLLDTAARPGPAGTRLSFRLRDLRPRGAVLWADRFDLPHDGAGTEREDILARTVVAVEAAALAAEQALAEEASGAAPDAHELVMRSLPLMFRMERDGFLRAGEHLRRAAELEPDFGPAWYLLVMWHCLLIVQKWTPDQAATIRDCRAALDKTLALAPCDARGIAIAGFAVGAVNGDLQAASPLFDRALERNPNLPMAWGLSAICQAYRGALDDAEYRFKRHKFLSPFSTLSFIHDTGGALIALLKRDHERAAAAGRIVTQTRPSFLMGYKPFLAALGHLGRQEEADTIARRLLALEPSFTVDGFLASSPLAPADLREHYAEGLRRAGLP